ncbi:MAG: response regulator [Bradyrhizobium sp.]|nr:MAG: response regulator [Bradyrhizobium sp.]
MVTPRPHETQSMSCLAKATARILVIDDDACVTTAIQAILLQRRYETVVASRAHAGIHTFQASQFDLVVIDLFMPGMNGFDTITRIRGESMVPIIAMSGFRLRNSLVPDQDCLGIARLLGATTSLRKPFSSLQLVEAVERALNLAPSNGGHCNDANRKSESPSSPSGKHGVRGPSDR